MTDQVLQLDGAQGLLRKISVNVLNKNADFTLFTLPIEGIPLTQEQLDAFMGQYTFRSWFDQKPDSSWHPCTWWATRTKGWELEGKFACDEVTLTIDGKDFTFEEYRADEEDDEDEDDGLRPGGRLSSVVLTPTAGGTTLLSFHLQVRPRLGKESTALLAHQFRHIAVTLERASASAGEEQQQSLPLVPDQTGHQSPPPVESKGGDQVDAELHERHPEASAEVMGADSQPDPGVTNTESAPRAAGMDPALEADVAKFEADAKARLDEFQQRATGAIDGTTMRSRGGRRRRNAAH